MNTSSTTNITLEKPIPTSTPCDTIYIEELQNGVECGTITNALSDATRFRFMFANK